MPTRIPIYRDDIYARLDKDKAEIKREINDVALLILKKLETNVYTENSKPQVHIQPMKKKK